MMNFDSIRTVYFSGIGGIGMSALARLFLQLGKRVVGSDLRTSAITEELARLGAQIYTEQKGEHVPWDADLFIYSEAEPIDHPERKRAKVAGLPSYNYPEALGLFMAAYRQRIAVSGTNGKTTTTAMLGMILEAAAKDPTVIVGSLVHQFQKSNARLGKSDLIVVEACEWRQHMLKLNPTTIILTNIEEDHLDFYRDLQHIKESFQRYISRLSEKGRLIFNGDDPISRELKPPSCEVLTYGRQKTSDLVIEDVQVKEGRQMVQWIWKGKSFEGWLRIPGLFNVYNAAAASACALSLGVSIESIQRTLSEFQGTWRRFQIVGAFQGAPIISDYAHHPTAIIGTLEAARSFYPDRRLVAVFQPHHRNRTKKLFRQFVESFDEADEVFITEVYDVAGREADEDAKVSGKDLVEAMKDHPSVSFVPTLKDLEEGLRATIQPDEVVVIMGAGDIYNVADRLVQERR